jgi:hypothetical protein
MRRSSLVCLALLAASLTGCTATARLYPVKGPLAAATPPPVLSARVTAHPPHSLSVLMTLPDGERIGGSLYVVMPAPKAPLPADVPPAMTAEWDTVYGKGAYVAHVLGQGQDARGQLVGDRGTTIRMELHFDTVARRMTSVAEDNKGNLFKVTFDRG